MAHAVLSSKFQMVIPKEVREQVGLKKGQRFQVIAKRGVITLVPEEPPSAYRGSLKGMRVSGLREKKDRF
jgi:AbrB family looped-hinge helix DNA binding protein